MVLSQTLSCPHPCPGPGMYPAILRVTSSKKQAKLLSATFSVSRWKNSAVLEGREGRGGVSLVERTVESQFA